MNKNRMMDNTIYDVIIVGAGMIGSAAARYASRYNDLKVCIIGPDEPKVGRRDCERDIYGAHYDQARITNSTQAHPIWSKLASRSMEQYRNLEKQSGIDFYTEAGSIWIGGKDGRNVATASKASADAGHAAQVLSPRQSMEKFPYIRIQEDEEVVYQQVAGYINPRKLVSAELLLAQRNNCVIIRDIVSKVEYPQNEDRPIKLHTDLGNTFYTKKILLAPGAFINSRQLLPEGFLPQLQFFRTCVVLAEVSEADLKRMRDMPSITKHVESDYKRDCYILPPVKYPNGKHYIKIGHGSAFDESITKSQIAQWYRQEVPLHIKLGLENLLRDIFPGFTPVSIQTDTCVTTRTQGRSLYVDLLTPRIGVAIAGNGYAAKACDYIGKIAADMIINSEWSCDLPQSWFKFRNITSKL